MWLRTPVFTRVAKTSASTFHQFGNVWRKARAKDISRLAAFHRGMWFRQQVFHRVPRLNVLTNKTRRPPMCNVQMFTRNNDTTLQTPQESGQRAATTQAHAQLPRLLASCPGSQNDVLMAISIVTSSGRYILNGEKGHPAEHRCCDGSHHNGPRQGGFVGLRAAAQGNL